MQFFYAVVVVLQSELEFYFNNPQNKGLNWSSKC